MLTLMVRGVTFLEPIEGSDRGSFITPAVQSGQ